MARLRVLLVDDEPAILRAYQRVLRGHDVALANDGAEALAAIRAHETFDLVVCDITMPEMNGVQLFERVCSERPALACRFVFATAGSTHDHIERFLANVPNRVIEKPFELRVLRELIDTLASA
jgi:CheY-like chemotaxis protein